MATQNSKPYLLAALKKNVFRPRNLGVLSHPQENPAPVDDFHVKLWLKWGRPATRDGKALGFSLLHIMIHGMFLTIKFGMSKKHEYAIYNLKETAIIRVLFFSFP